MRWLSLLCILFSLNALGSLAGRGYNGQKKGGKLKIKVNEPCYIMGIVSITPLVDYSQGNDWDNWLKLWMTCTSRSWTVSVIRI